INRDADLVLIAVNDDAIAGVAKKLEHFSGTVVHTSGSVGMDVLKRSARRGVLYPLQTVSGNRPLRLKNIPLCVEASGKETKKLLHTIAGTLSHDVHDINSGERRKLHLAAVFVNNFSNHLYTLAEEYLRTNRLSFNLLRPLILETAKKAVENSPAKSQTGPAARNDTRTISAHLALLKKNKQMKKIYTDLTASILERSRQKRS
ncbi:MAG TPA: Rossmann-like and DUF2520 domain-containing protein, partial [Bacteroidia bacterium]|nr:Rossmann-like and DUF2520 domain-containing protein [Bacteroidia bacterium]